MEQLSAWIMSIAGIALIGILIDIILPSGEMQKYCRSVFALIMLLVIITPIPSILSANTSLSFDFMGKSTQIDSNYVESVNKARLKVLERSCELELKDKGFGGVAVTITVNQYSEDMKIVSVLADLKNLVMENGQVNINYSDRVKQILADFLSISKEEIICVG